MRTLLLQLPTQPPGPSEVYGLAWLDSARNQRISPSPSPLALLPRADRQVEVVAMVPATMLSWHRISLPAGLGRSSARLQAALIGLLEDRLLQEPSQLHLALPAQWQAGEPTWVAVCDKVWLQAHVQALDEAGLPVQRIVPELAPPAEGQVWHALGDEASGWLWCCSADHGVSGWPLGAATHLPSDWLAHDSVQSEPALAQWVQARLALTPELVDPASHWQHALTGPWNLAQFDLQSRRGTRGWQRLLRWLEPLLRQPQWRPARRGLAALLLIELLGLNAWAWMTSRHWEAQQAQWTQILQQSFPKVTVVIDAPLQMAREVARLRQSSGQLGTQDFESMLQALGAALPEGMTGPASLSYQDGVLQWPGLPMNPAQQTAFMQALQRQGYTLQVQGANWRLQSAEKAP